MRKELAPCPVFDILIAYCLFDSLSLHNNLTEQRLEPHLLQVDELRLRKGRHPSKFCSRGRTSACASPCTACLFLLGENQAVYQGCCPVQGIHPTSSGRAHWTLVGALKLLGKLRGYCIHPYPAGRHAVPSATNKVPLQKLGFQKDLM